MTPRLAALTLLVGLASMPAPASAAAQPVQLRTADGVPIAAALYQADGDAPAVVLVHMYTRTKEDWRPFAERLQASGLTALAIDLRGHGASGGVSTPAPAMALDVQAAIGFLAARSGGRGIAIVGASLGASAANMAAAESPGVRGVALLSPASDYRGVRIDAALRKYGGAADVPHRQHRRSAGRAHGARTRGQRRRSPPGTSAPVARRRRTAPRSSTATPTWPRRLWTG